MGGRGLRWGGVVPGMAHCADEAPRGHRRQGVCRAWGLRVKMVGNSQKKPLTVFTRIIFCSVVIG
jgi:hypothetical protein